MDDLKPTHDASTRAARAGPQTLDPTPEGLARRFFILTMLGLVAYIAAITVLLSSGN